MRIMPERARLKYEWAINPKGFWKTPFKGVRSFRTHVQYNRRSLLIPFRGFTPYS